MADAMAAATIEAIDVQAWPAQGGWDLTEAKEALVDALVTMTGDRVSGRLGGERVYGMKPSARFVSGHLLPRFDEQGVADETSDIRISAFGIDLMVDSGWTGAITVSGAFAVYVRVLPTWDELTDPRLDLFPSFRLRKDVEKKLNRLAQQVIRRRVAKRFPELARRNDDADGADLDETKPKVPDGVEEDSGEPSESAVAAAIAAATQKPKEQSDADGGVEAGDDLDAGKADPDRWTARRQRWDAIRDIRRSVFERFYRRLGIVPITPVDPVVGDDGDVAQQDGSDQEKPEDEDGSSAPANGAILLGRVRMPDGVAAAVEIPMKWRRFMVEIPPQDVPVADADAHADALDRLAVGIAASIRVAVAGWLAAGGDREAYRPVRALPSAFESAEAWEAFLDRQVRGVAVRFEDVAPEIDGRRTGDGLKVLVERSVDLRDPARTALRVSLENDAPREPQGWQGRLENAAFLTRLRVELPQSVHRSLRLDRIEASYRYRHHLDYPAMGFNCGVVVAEAPDGRCAFETTWAPRFAQPRIEPSALDGVEVRYRELAREDFDVGSLATIADQYERWIGDLDASKAAVLSELQGDERDREERVFDEDVELHRREAGYIRRGADLLARSREAWGAWQRGGRRDRDLALRAAPYRAWRLTNEAFFEAAGGDASELARTRGWRLFQLAFVLVHVPVFASRMDAFRTTDFDAVRDEETASLLFFPTGGGKSEAFFGALVFGLFLDRLRGKHRGVTALIRYPLRLLTLQQARRLLRLLVRAEMLRARLQLGAPFEIGFWVGSNNTPNKAMHKHFAPVPRMGRGEFATDDLLLRPPAATDKATRDFARAAARYRFAWASYNKVPECPCCGSRTLLRRERDAGQRIVIVCPSPECPWNAAGAGAARTPLPFILTDDTIYERAPSVLLGTVDKLALLGQHDATISRIVGMFGMARLVEGTSRHLAVPRRQQELAEEPAPGWLRVAPAYPNGEREFHDPFPLMTIADEAHLLEESLGSFSGLFETMLEAVFCRLGTGPLAGVVAMRPDNGQPRMPKVIAATATVSGPRRQLEALYQRRPLRFPCPGPDLYRSFYSVPAALRLAERGTWAEALPPSEVPERAAPWMRLYVSIMTNGRAHTQTTVSVLSAYHLAVTELWDDLAEGADDARRQAAATRIAAAVSGREPLAGWRREAIGRLAAAQRWDVLLSLLDLMRVSLTYVTNKKGGDQVIDAFREQARRDHAEAGKDIGPGIESDLISGGVEIAHIQEVMRKAEGGARPGRPFGALRRSLRSIVATSAISHGVDVDKFNAMFFAGAPSDIAEYIQASSRVGRTHVGFSVLIPTPQARRDRYILETHDSFHRLLERMIAPPAIERWADEAIRRVVASLFQAYLCAVIEPSLFAPAVAGGQVPLAFVTVRDVAHRISTVGRLAFEADLAEFCLDAVGFRGRGVDRVGAPVHAAHYEEMIRRAVNSLVGRFVGQTSSMRLAEFWANQTEFRKPMTSLRDVDEGGVIMAAGYDGWSNRATRLETIARVMRVIRGQQGLAGATDPDSDGKEE